MTQTPPLPIVHPTPDELNESLGSLTFHGSPPPSLTARFGAQVRIDGDDTKRLPPEHDTDPEAAINSFIENLLNPDHAETSPHLLAIGYELEALVSIYTPSAVRLSATSRPSSWAPTTLPTTSISSLLDPATTSDSASVSMIAGPSRNSQAWTDALRDYNSGLIPTERIRYEVTIPAWEHGEKLEGVEEDVVPDQPPLLRVLVSLPPTYPNTSPPQLQLLGRYLGNFPIDSGLFGDITRTYISSSGVTFTPGDVCVFEGLTHVQSLARIWYAQNLSTEHSSEKARLAEKKKANSTSDLILETAPDSTLAPPIRPSPSRANFSYSKQEGDNESNTPQSVHNANEGKPSGLKIVSSEPIIEKKSTFVGHAVRVTDEREVPLVIHELLSDRKIAKAAHPAIFAYRIAKEVGGPAGKVYNTDYDDDGETQAGARLKHLLEILELENVLVVVSRWFGGTLLGPDRFKYINQAARDALELGGFLDEKEKEGGNKGKGKKK